MVELAARQRGIVAFWQLAALGFTHSMVRRRVENGRLYRVCRGVYSLTPSPPPAARMLAAAFSYGPGAVLSHHAAGAVWDVCAWPTAVFDVTVEQGGKAQQGIRVHRVRVKPVVRNGFPVTTVTRTLIDLAAVLPLARLRDAFERAERLRLLDARQVDEQMLGRRGAKKIRALLAETEEPEPARSELERAFRELCKQHELPLPSQNVVLCGYEVDAFWPEQRLIVELDGWEWHRTRRAFEEDRRKAVALEAAGYRMLRFTWRQVKREPELLAAAVRSGCPTAAGRAPAPARAAARPPSAP
jgi:very-short-patch-repair endonuclease